MNSALNPDAPEFFPIFTSVTQEQQPVDFLHLSAKPELRPMFGRCNDGQGGYKSVHKSIRSSNVMPIGISYDFFKTFTDFNILTSHLSKSVLSQSNHIVATELPVVKLKLNEREYNTDKIVDTNDSILDRVNINIDTASGVNRSYNLSNGNAPVISSWNHAPVIAKIQMGSTTLIGAKNIPRPQLSFKDKIDNSESLWVPKISDKPNNIKPLALNILYNDEGEAVGYEHPYKVELELFQPSSHMLEPDAEEPHFPEPLEDTKFTYVDTEAKLDALVEHLITVNELAVDLEHHAYRTYQGITCLIQISTDEGGDFIVDALAVREHIHKLNIVFTDPKKIKVFHGAESDVVWLQRDFGVYVVGLFDTHQAAKVLNLTGLSLKHLLMKYCRVDADKKYQLADWRMRPLPEELVKYARMDTHYLLYIWKKMRAELLDNGGSQPHLLLSVFENSRHICGTTYNKEFLTDSSHLPLYVRSRKSFNSQQMAALKLLYKWRDTQARSLDESTSYLLPHHMLLSLAETLPREIQGVHAVCSPMPPFIKQNLLTVHKMILSCRELPNEPQLYQMPTHLMNTQNTLQMISYDVHDFYPQYSEDSGIKLEPTVDLYEEYSQSQKYAPTALHVEPKSFVSHLNAEAEQFIPPFDRYRHYRTLAQIEEISELKEKEAKIAAIGKGNELIKAEVLVKIQQAQSLIENEKKKNLPQGDIIDIETTSKKTQKRKRKMNAEKADPKEPVDNPEHKKKELIHTDSNKKSDSAVKPFRYKNADYKKFYNDSNKDHKQKQPKMKFKKHKK